MNETTEWIIARLDFYFDISECIINYFRKHNDVSFSIAASTYDLVKSQLQHFMREHAAEIFNDDALTNYYYATIDNFDFIENNLYNK